MWMEKLADGVLCVQTPIGLRYIRPSLWQRIYLVWIFRHFHTLPQQVLSAGQQRLIDTLCVEHRFVSLPGEMEGVPIIGTLERRPPIGVEAMEPSGVASRVMDAAVSALAANLRQQS